MRESSKYSRIAAAVLLLVTVCTTLTCMSCGKVSHGKNEQLTDIPDSGVPASSGEGIDNPGNGVYDEKSAFGAVSAMGVGWNLGNTLDTIDNKKKGILSELKSVSPEEYYETYWGNPVTTRKMIDDVAEAGFNAIRVPVTYTDHMGDDFKIREEWLERVGQVVNYVLDNDIYCIINIHHDTGSGSWPWLKADPDNAAIMEERLRSVWTQIAMYFKDYDGRLIFESFNEILDTRNRWSGSSSASYELVNDLNQIFVDTVRVTGANNKERILIVKTYAAGVDGDILDAFRLPDDTVKDRLIVGVHYYGVLTFTWRQERVSWAETYTDWDRTRDGAPVEDVMKRLNSLFIKKGVPVIICEFGAQNKGNTDDRVAFVRHYVETGKQYGIMCIWWDDGGDFPDALSVDSYTIYDRRKNLWFFPQIAEAMVTAAA